MPARKLSTVRPESLSRFERDDKTIIAGRVKRAGGQIVIVVGYHSLPETQRRVVHTLIEDSNWPFVFLERQQNVGEAHRQLTRAGVLTHPIFPCDEEGHVVLRHEETQPVHDADARAFGAWLKDLGVTGVSLMGLFHSTPPHELGLRGLVGLFAPLQRVLTFSHSAPELYGPAGNLFKQLSARPGLNVDWIDEGSFDASATQVVATQPGRTNEAPSNKALKKPAGRSRPPLGSGFRLVGSDGCERVLTEDEIRRALAKRNPPEGEE